MLKVLVAVLAVAVTEVFRRHQASGAQTGSCDELGQCQNGHEQSFKPSMACMLHCTVHGSVVVCLPCEETVKSYTEFVGFSSFHAFDMRLILCAVLRLGPGFPASLKVPREAGTGMENVRNDPMLKNYLYLLSMILVFGEHIKPHNGTL